MAARAKEASREHAGSSPGGQRSSNWWVTPCLVWRVVSRTLLTAVVMLAISVLAFPVQVASSVRVGVTFSPRYAASLGLDSRAAYAMMLDELPFHEIRLPVYWDEVETAEGVYDFGAVDWHISEAAARGRTVIPVLGYKAPRWPECHPPSWVAGRTVPEKRTAILRLLRAEVDHFQRHPNFELWQIENEPFFPFGECDGCAVLDEAFVAQEVALVRQLDHRAVLVTDSGELSSWTQAMRSGDRFGSSLYRSIWFEYVGLVSYPILPAVYAAKDRVARLMTGASGESIVIEMQAEPWFMTGGSIVDVPLGQQISKFPRRPSVSMLGMRGRLALQRLTSGVWSGGTGCRVRGILAISPPCSSYLLRSESRKHRWRATSRTSRLWSNCWPTTRPS
jgi:hypothetical protein